MPFAAITYDIKPGCEDGIASIFQSFTRPASPVVRDENGTKTAEILATAVFIRDATMVRVIQYDGSLDEVARYMASQPGVQEVERRLKPYLASPRDTATVAGFVKTFHDSTLRCISQLPPPRGGAAAEAAGARTPQAQPPVSRSSAV
jgi:SchA/CurD like domain